MFSLLLKWFVGVFTLLLLIATLNSYWLEHSPDEARFLAGTIPKPLPNGFYNGHLAVPNPVWLGKKFDYDTDTGTNVFKSAAGLSNEGFGFITYAGKGIRDTTLDVLKIDYSTPDNPFWLSPVLDEIVQVDDDHYLGKLFIKFLPGHPFTVAFFELTR